MPQGARFYEYATKSPATWRFPSASLSFTSRETYHHRDEHQRQNGKDDVMIIGTVHTAPRPINDAAKALQK
jgi:hypothetical protein